MSAAEDDLNSLTISDFQQRVLGVPESVSILLGGGRGGGKSMCLPLLAQQHIERYRSQAKILLLRRQYKDLEEIITNLILFFGRIYGADCRAWYNRTDHVWRFSSAATLELGQLENVADFLKFQGRSFTLLLIDELGHWPTPSLFMMIRSCLRAPVDVPTRIICTANPADPGHGWIKQRLHRSPTATGRWAVFREEETQRLWTYIPSTILQNPFLDQAAYVRELRAMAVHDPEKARAWINGDWNVKAGAYFAAVLDERRSMIDDWPYIPSGWRTYLAYDHGTQAPAVCLLMARAIDGTTGPNGDYFPRGSVVVVSEFASSQPDNIELGMGYSVSHLADRVKRQCEEFCVAPRGVADDALFADDGSTPLGEEFGRCGVYFVGSRKGRRVQGWAVMRDMLANAQRAVKREKPGLYVTRRCKGWWQTVPALAHDPHDRDDLDTRLADHWADATRYGLLRVAMQLTVEEFHL